MKKRVCSVLLAAVLCVTMLSVVALATESTDCNHTYTGNNYVANANGINHSPRCDKCDYVDTSRSRQHCDNGSNSIKMENVTIVMQSWLFPLMTRPVVAAPPLCKLLLTM